MKRTEPTTKISNVSASRKIQVTILSTETSLEYKKILQPLETSLFLTDSGSAYMTVTNPDTGTTYWQGNIPWKVNGTIAIDPDNKTVTYEGYTIPTRKSWSYNRWWLYAIILLIIIVIIYLIIRNRKRRH